MGKDTGQSWLDQLDGMVAENSKLVLFLILQIVIIGLLIIGYLKMIDKIQVKIELPTIVKEEGIVIVGKEYANDKFFRMWAREDVEIVSNFNQKSITKKIEYLRDRMYPPFFYKHEKIFKDYERQVSTDLISQKFTFAKESITDKVSNDGKKATVNINGFYSKTIDEDRVIDAQPCSYTLGYTIEGGHIYVTSFKTTCK